ncbi:Hpt domain-containing protein [Hyphomonas johnsonii]|nr:Hpt domain-containing protein [Hyphomonas johnsonii]
MTDESPAPLALLDRAQLRAMTGNDTALAVEVIEIFRQQAEIWSRLLDPRAEPSQWADAAHTLKGASLSIGAVRLASLCGRAERMGRDEPPPSLTAAAVMLGDVKDLLGETLEAAAKTSYDFTLAASRKAS